MADRTSMITIEVTMILNMAMAGAYATNYACILLFRRTYECPLDNSEDSTSTPEPNAI